MPKLSDISKIELRNGDSTNNQFQYETTYWVFYGNFLEFIWYHFVDIRNNSEVLDIYNLPIGKNNYLLYKIEKQRLMTQLGPNEIKGNWVNVTGIDLFHM